ncbi:MAG: 6-carboxytetrahydropterin synthase QueD [PVC group bacterium]|nr:6-carboxytetrahydropterin synthase QueD [PVC group bacterium]
MFEISVVSNFSAAHNLLNYKGKCENLHGHNWQVEAVFGAEELDKSEMVMDFKDAKKILKNILRSFDHSYINDTEHFKKMSPTSENIARFIFKCLVEKTKHRKYRVLRVSVWETPGSKATYYE